VRGCRGDHGVVVGVLREGLDLDLDLALRRVVGVDDRLVGRELGCVAGVVGPEGEGAVGTIAGTAA
jgi:hypothetical protein